jgi:hypothetical protein
MAKLAPTLSWTLALHARQLVSSDDCQISLLASDDVRRHASARHLLLVYNLAGLWDQGAGFVRVWEFSRCSVSFFRSFVLSSFRTPTSCPGPANFFPQFQSPFAASFWVIFLNLLGVGC